MQDEILIKFTCKNSARLDIALFEANESISRNSISQAIKAGLVKVNDLAQTKPAKIVQAGDIITLFKAKTIQNQAKILECELFEKIQILYEDDDILVISKPSGLVVHEANSVKVPTLVDFLKQSNRQLSTLGGEFRAGIVHRLDKLTSGVMVVAKNDFASANLSEQLKQKSAKRFYLALVDLALKQNCIITKAIGRCEKNRLKKAIYPENKNGAKMAQSAFCNIFLDEILPNLAKKNVNLIAAKLFTGRTHQIRVHLSSINRHILGDFLYGFKGDQDKIRRIFLHAFILELTHPKSGKNLRFQAPLPDEFALMLGLKKEKLNENITMEFVLSCFNDVDKWLCIN